MNIMYIHGAYSKFDPNNARFADMEDVNVYGFTHTFKNSLDEIIEMARKVLIENDIDIIVGCSLGGYLASIVSDRFTIPAVAINPVYDINIIHSKYDVTDAFVESTKDIDFKPRMVGHVYLGREDDVIDPIKSYKKLTFLGMEPWYITLMPGDHRMVKIDSLYDTLVSVNSSTALLGDGSND